MAGQNRVFVANFTNDFLLIEIDNDDLKVKYEKKKSKKNKLTKNVWTGSTLYEKIIRTLRGKF